MALFFVGVVFIYNFFRCIFGLLKWNSPVGKLCHSPQLRNKSLNLFIPRPLDERQVCAWIRLKARVDLVFGQLLAARSDDRRRQFLARSQRCGKDVIRGEGRTVRYLRFFEQFFFRAKAAETSSKSSIVWLLPKLYWFRWNNFFFHLFFGLNFWKIPKYNKNINFQKINNSKNGPTPLLEDLVQVFATKPFRVDFEKLVAFSS